MTGKTRTGKTRLGVFNVTINYKGMITIVDASLDAWSQNKKFIKEFKAMSDEDQIDLITLELFGAGCQMGEVRITGLRLAEAA